MTDIRYYASMEEVEQAIEDQEGICRACGEHFANLGPTAQRYECEFCGEDAVYGAEQFLREGWIE